MTESTKVDIMPHLTPERSARLAELVEDRHETDYQCFQELRELFQLFGDIQLAEAIERIDESMADTDPDSIEGAPDSHEHPKTYAETMVQRIADLLKERGEIDNRILGIMAGRDA